MSTTTKQRVPAPAESPRHTPGPWYVGPDISSGGRLVYLQIFPKSAPGRRAIANTGVYGHHKDGTTAGKRYVDEFGTERHEPVVTPEVAHANAALIAAAPELLEALQGAAGYLDHYIQEIGGCDHAVNICCCDEVRALEKYRALIAKAEGR